jgi:hypothetical protein
MMIWSISKEKEKIDPISLVPAIFGKCTHIMTKKAAANLRSHKPYDYAIDINDGERLLLGPCCALSNKKLQVLQDWFKEMLKIGTIRSSK